ncbi:MAG: hypothetical protein LBL24_11135 [Bacteroidales bacterium]|nr:hypothetical protein [Bacteroidales bacterium]
MKPAILYSVFLFYLFSLNVFAVNNKNIPSKLEEVTVFFQGAELVYCII